MFCKQEQSNQSHGDNQQVLYTGCGNVWDQDNISGGDPIYSGTVT